MALRRSKTLFPASANRLVTPPVNEPVTADELRSLLREGLSGLPDVEANGLIEIARQWVEDQIGVAFVDQTWRLTMDSWPCGAAVWWSGTKQGAMADLHRPQNHTVSPPRWPMSAVTSVTVYADDGTPSTIVVADVFDVDTASIPARIALKRNAVWPANLRSINAIEIVYVAGYGGDGVLVPAAMKRAILQVAAGLYVNRGDGCDNVADTSTKALIASYRIVKI